MKIILSPQRRNDTLTVVKDARVLHVNGERFDFSRMPEGATLPLSAISSQWFVGDLTVTDGELTLTLLLPIPANFSPAQAFPEPLIEVPDGLVALPAPLPVQDDELAFTDPHPGGCGSAAHHPKDGAIDWTQLVTWEMRQAAAAAQRLAEISNEVARLRAAADYQILPLQDAEDLEEATESEVLSLRAWKKYRIALSRLGEQAGFPEHVVWPEMPRDTANIPAMSGVTFPNGLV